MSPEIDLLNTYRVSGQERLRTLYHLETAKDWQGNDVEVLCMTYLSMCVSRWPWRD
jgi:hypothetical protein